MGMKVAKKYNQNALVNQARSPQPPPNTTFSERNLDPALHKEDDVVRQTLHARLVRSNVEDSEANSSGSDIDVDKDDEGDGGDGGHRGDEGDNRDNRDNRDEGDNGDELLFNGFNCFSNLEKASFNDSFDVGEILSDQNSKVSFMEKLRVSFNEHKESVLVAHSTLALSATAGTSELSSSNTTDLGGVMRKKRAAADSNSIMHTNAHLTTVW
ncbi:hypothetical protein DEU56DRAFT_905961 [Suillus clintonianus]|uniref:uncharacterized protein n=1 Tax=Suillus clintonianus TaxID=1904413 RepID=UPI001B870213|nr:uncharacterized protein DEU56DRAFT_905961 [Suillus clintonianus]KAG2157306.1 hypothetical protein DEU56DRAFT_905961 [Suillus clintonianus]